MHVLIFIIYLSDSDAYPKKTYQRHVIINMPQEETHKRVQMRTWNTWTQYTSSLNLSSHDCQYKLCQAWTMEILHNQEVARM